MDFLNNTAVRIALGAVATTAVAAGSYLIGKQHGMAETIAQLPTILADLFDETEDETSK